LYDRQQLIALLRLYIGWEHLKQLRILSWRCRGNLLVSGSLLRHGGKHTHATHPSTRESACHFDCYIDRLSLMRSTQLLHTSASNAEADQLLNLKSEWPTSMLKNL
jgi:hypothetical protein